VTTRDLTPAETALFMSQELDPAFGLPLRLAARISVDLDCGCWLVSGYGTGKGHKKSFAMGREHKAHRLVYTCLVGPIPEDHVLDHVRALGCRHRSCANPAHLEPVTTQENTRRGDGVRHQFGRRAA
jgi:HNH endonuclease